MNRPVVGAVVVDEACVLDVLAAGVLLWKLNVGLGVSEFVAGVETAAVPELAGAADFKPPNSPFPPVLAPADWNGEFVAAGVDDGSAGFEVENPAKGC